MLIFLGILLVVGWILAKLVWHVASFGVHFLLIAAVVAVVIHVVRSRSSGGTRLP